MSEIPLHTFGRSRKSRAGYTPLHNGEPGERIPNPTEMRAGIPAAASASSLNRKGKRRERYVGDLEEEATLLGDDSREDDEYLDDQVEQRTRDSSSQVSLTYTMVYLRLRVLAF